MCIIKENKRKEYRNTDRRIWFNRTALRSNTVLVARKGGGLNTPTVGLPIPVGVFPPVAAHAPDVLGLNAGAEEAARKNELNEVQVKKYIAIWDV